MAIFEKRQTMADLFSYSNPQENWSQKSKFIRSWKKLHSQNRSNWSQKIILLIK